MLSRIANSLFWMGRYLERAEHAARYINVQYFSTLDAPNLSKKEFVLDSITSMTGLTLNPEERLRDYKEQKLIYRIALDDQNAVSIKSNIFRARENARGARDILSSELWESVNQFFHTVNMYSSRKLTEEDILSFTEMVMENCAIVNSYIDHSLLHDDTWSLIQLGIHTETAGQITRILMSKVHDMQKVGELKLGKAMETYQCVTLLKSAEAFDMSRTHYKVVPNLRNTLEFLMLNRLFPRSILFNLEAIKHHLNNISHKGHESKDSAEFFSGKLCAQYSFLTIEEVEANVFPFLAKTLGDIYRLGNLLENRIS